jgi:hypothetical protein
VQPKISVYFIILRRKQARPSMPIPSRKTGAGSGTFTGTELPLI